MFSLNICMPLNSEFCEGKVRLNHDEASMFFLRLSKGRREIFFLEREYIFHKKEELP